MDVVGGEVGQRAAAVVVVLDPHCPRPPGRHGGVAPAPDLDGGLLVGTDDVLVGAELPALPAALVKPEYPGRPGGEVGVAH